MSNLLKKKQREHDQEEVIQDFRQKLEPFKKEMFITASAIPNIKGAGVSVPYQIVLKSDSFEALEKAKKNLVAHLAKKEGFVDIDTDLDEQKPKIDINFIRENASLLGVSASQIAEAVAIAFSSDLEISYFEQSGNSTISRLGLVMKTE